MANKRIYYAVQQAGVSRLGENTFTSIHGLQSVGKTVRFNLEQVFEIGQISIYENIENIPDVEFTLEKVMDGYAPIYMLCTNGALSATLSGRSNVRCTIGLSIYGDTQDSASGVPVSQCTASGMYISSLRYTLPTEGNCSEQVTLVGNNVVWNNTFTPTAFTNDDEPLAIAGSGGVNRREDVLFGEQASPVPSKLPPDIPGITASGYNPLNTTLNEFGAHIRQIAVATNLGREQLFELGRRGPYHRFASFPTEVTCEIEVISTEGDKVTALEDATSNLTNRTIDIRMREGTRLNLGTRNKLSNVTYGGADAGQNAGNAAVTYSYSNFNDLSVTHPQDPSGL